MEGCFGFPEALKRGIREERSTFDRDGGMGLRGRWIHQLVFQKESRKKTLYKLGQFVL